MALKCRINNGTVEAPNGKESKLYLNLEDRLGSDKAIELYALTETVDYKDMTTLAVDSNGEMNTNDFLRFALSSENEYDFKKEGAEFTQKFSSEELKNLDKLYVSGIFHATQEALKNTGLFTEDEIIEIVYSPEKQKNLKDFVDTFEGSDVTTVETFKIEDHKYNGIGIKPLLNPEEVQEKVLDILLKAKDLNELDLLFQTLPYPSMIKKYNDSQGFKDYIRGLVRNSFKVPVERDTDMTIERLYNTMDVEAFGDISDTTRRIEVLNDKDFIVEEFEAIVDSLISAGVEIDFDEASLYSKSIEELKGFSAALQNFVTSPTAKTAQDFAKVVGDFEEITTEKIITNFENKYVDKRSLRYFDSIKNEIEAFDNNSLIKHSDSVYQKVNNAYSIDQLYEFLYNKLISDPSFDSGGISVANIPSAENSINKLGDDVNKEAIIDDLKIIVRDNTKFLPFADIVTQEKITLYKMFYGAPVDSHNTNSVVTPVKNQEYLEGDFVHNFNVDRLYSKKDEIDQYNNFYKHFNVDHKGIRLVNDNFFSVDTILANIPLNIIEEIIEYSRISKHLDLGQSVVEKDIPTMGRLKAQQNPQSVKRLTKDYQVSEKDEFITEETEQFINLRGDIYEKVLSFQDKNLYKMLPKSGAVYNNTNINKPISGKSPQYLRDFVATVNNTIFNKKYLTKQELEGINQKHFECE